jgi:ATP phosphoribosyltransferase regulatory subunit
MRAWLLPENTEDVLPPQAWKMEELRRTLLDHFRSHGYELVIPPMIEYLDSLLSGTGADLDLKTFKLVDQLSGRLMGVRADITPQVARIDAHLLGENSVNRLCYAGSVLHTQPDGYQRSREPIQLGAELYGESGSSADLEIVRLMLDGLAAIGLKELQLDLGHVGIYHALAAKSGLEPESRQTLFRALQSKSQSEVNNLTGSMHKELHDAFMALTQLYGDIAVLAEARKRLPAMPEIAAALDDLEFLSDSLSGNGVEVAFDLAELRGYGYHSGMVFAAYSTSHSRAIALGGRYDEVGKIFGRARPATGFSLDLRELVESV